MKDFKFVWVDYSYHKHYEESFDNALDAVFDYLLSIYKPTYLDFEFTLTRDKDKNLSAIPIFRLIPNFFEGNNFVFVVNVCVKF